MMNELPLTIGYWLAALAPLAALLIMLVGFKWSAPKSGTISVIIAIILAFTMYQAPIQTLLVATGKGLWDALSVLLIIWTAMLLYQVSDRASAFHAIRQGVLKYSRNYLFLILAFGWVFASFMQGIAGFGTPIAVVAPLLIGIGVKPVFAVVIPLIGHNWANTFGSLGVAWLAANQIITFDNPAQAALIAAIPLWFLNLFSGLVITYIYGKWEGVKQGLPAVLLISFIHGGGQMLLAPIEPTLANFVPTIIAFGVLLLLPKLKRYRENQGIKSDILISQDEQQIEEIYEGNKLSLIDAIMPYVFLSVVTVIGLAIPSVKAFLSQFYVGFSFPETTTGFNFVVPEAAPFGPIRVFTTPAFFILLSAIFAYLWYKAKGMYNGVTFMTIFKEFLGGVVKSTISISMFLIMANMLEHTGQTSVLAFGIAKVSSPLMYAGLSHWIGMIGSFMTSSNTASNILMSPLHQSVVADMSGLSLSTVIAGQTSGGALGNAIAPSNIILGVTTARIENKSSEVLKYTLTFSILAGMMVSGIIMLIHLFMPV